MRCPQQIKLSPTHPICRYEKKFNLPTPSIPVQSTRLIHITFKTSRIRTIFCISHYMIPVQSHSTQSRRHLHHQYCLLCSAKYSCSHFSKLQYYFYASRYFYSIVLQSIREPLTIIPEPISHILAPRFIRSAFNLLASKPTSENEESCNPSSCLRRLV